MTSAPLDFRRLLAEIEDEARHKRTTGELSAEFERELDLAFARYAPVDAVDGDFDALVAKLETSTTIDTRAPVESSRPGVAQLKRVVGKAIDWDLRHVANQVSGLSHALLKALRLLADRIDALEESTLTGADQALFSRAADGGRLPDGPWIEVVRVAFDGVTGRVLHGECGEGELLAQLQEDGLDAYGVEPDEDTALRAGDRAVDVRADDVRTHLRSLPAGSLRGLILSGCVDRLPPGAVLDLLDLTASRLAPGGRLAIVSSHPAAWGRQRSIVVADLAPGRPLHPETWLSALRIRGFADEAEHLGPSPEGLTPVSATDDSAVVLNANLARLNEVLFGPAAYAITATR